MCVYIYSISEQGSNALPLASGVILQSSVFTHHFTRLLLTYIPGTVKDYGGVTE